MNDREQLRYERLLRVRTFGTENPAESALLTVADRVIAKFEIIPGEPPATSAAKTALTQRFLAYELPADFVTDLRSDLNAVRNATDQNYGEIQEGTGHTALIGPTLAAAAKDVQELDTIMQNKYARQPDKLRAWLSASRVERTATKKKEEPPTPPAPAPGQ